MKKIIATPVALLSAGIALASALLSVSAAAQQFPSKPVTILVGFPAGGVLDWMARALGPKLTERWGQPVVVENRVGGGGLIAIQAVQKAPPDGHILATHTAQVALLPLFVKDADVVPGKNLQPVTTAFYAPYALITNTQTPVKNLREFVAHVKSNPGKLNFAYVPLTGQQLDSISFAKTTGMDIALIPYKGGVPALTALFANEAQFYFGAAFGLDGHVKAGRITPLAVTGATRFPQLPDVPTIKEAIGIDFVSVVDYGYYTTQGTPKAVVDKLSRDIADVMQSNEMKDQIRKQGYEPRAIPNEEWLVKITAEVRHATELAQAAGIKPQ